MAFAMFVIAAIGPNAPETPLRTVWKVCSKKNTFPPYFLNMSVKSRRVSLA